jgi:hypothetical protein
MCKSLAPCFTHAESNLSMRIVPMLHLSPGSSPRQKTKTACNQEPVANSLGPAESLRLPAQRSARQLAPLPGTRQGNASILFSPRRRSPAPQSGFEWRTLLSPQPTAIEPMAKRQGHPAQHRQIVVYQKIRGEQWIIRRAIYKLKKTAMFSWRGRIRSRRPIHLRSMITSQHIQGGDPLFRPFGNAEHFFDGRDAFQYFADSVVVKR